MLYTYLKLFSNCALHVLDVVDKSILRVHAQTIGNHQVHKSVPQNIRQESRIDQFEL